MAATRGPQSFLPWAPLEAAALVFVRARQLDIESSYHRESSAQHDAGNQDRTVAALADVLGIHNRAYVYRYRKLNRVPFDAGERYCCNLGELPFAVWGDGYWQATLPKPKRMSKKQRLAQRKLLDHLIWLAQCDAEYHEEMCA